MSYVTITFEDAMGPSPWTPATSSFHPILASFGSNHYTSCSISKEIMEVTLMTSTKTPKEVARHISNYTQRWKSTCGIPGVKIVREYREPGSAGSSTDQPGLVAVAPTWVPTEKWKHAADFYFRDRRAASCGGILTETSEPISDNLIFANSHMFPHLVMFPGFPDSSLKIVPAYDGHLDLNANMGLHQLVEVPNQTETKMVQCSMEFVGCKTNEALTDRIFDRKVANGEDEDYNSGEEWAATYTGKYDGLRGQAFVSRMKEDGKKRQILRLREDARVCADTKRAAEETNRILADSDVTHEMYVLDIDENEIRETALRLAPIAYAYKLVVGGSAASKVATKAGVKGMICACLASPAIPTAMAAHDGWFRDSAPSVVRAWLDTVGVALKDCYRMDNRLLLGSYSHLVKEVRRRRGVKRGHA